MADDSTFPQLVTVLTSTHLLLASSAASPGALGVLPCFTYGCVHSYCWAWGFICFLPVTPAGSRIVCPRSERRFSVPVWVRYTGQFLVGPHTSVCGVSACPVPQGVLPGGPRCVHELRLSLALSSVLHCPMLEFSVASTTLATGLGLSLVPCPTFCRLRFVPQSVAQLCALQPLAPSFRVVLTEAAGLGRFLVLSIVLPWP